MVNLLRGNSAFFQIYIKNLSADIYIQYIQFYSVNWPENKATFTKNELLCRHCKPSLLIKPCKIEEKRQYFITYGNRCLANYLPHFHKIIEQNDYCNHAINL